MSRLNVNWEPERRRQSVSFKTFLLLTLGAAVLVFCMVMLLIH